MLVDSLKYIYTVCKLQRLQSECKDVQNEPSLIVNRDRIACLTGPCPSHKKLFRKNFNILLTPPPTSTPGVLQ